MRKNLFFTIFLALSFVFTIISCTQDYRKACAERDFAKAYSIVYEMKEKQEEKEHCRYINGSYEPLKYVILQEAMVVLEENGEDGLIRIAGIVKEHNAAWLYDELITLFKSTGNKELLEKLERMDPHRAILASETPIISGILKGYFEVSGQTAKIENEYLVVNLKRVKKGNPKQRKPYYKFSVVIKNEVGSVIFRQVTPLGGYYEEGLTSIIIDEERDYYTYDDVMNEDELSCKFYIPKETYDMKSFTISSEDY